MKKTTLGRMRSSDQQCALQRDLVFWNVSFSAPFEARPWGFLENRATISTMGA